MDHINKIRCKKSCFFKIIKVVKGRCLICFIHKILMDIFPVKIYTRQNVAQLVQLKLMDLETSNRTRNKPIQHYRSDYTFCF